MKKKNNPLLLSLSFSASPGEMRDCLENAPWTDIWQGVILPSGFSIIILIANILLPLILWCQLPLWEPYISQKAFWNLKMKYSTKRPLRISLPAEMKCRCALRYGATTDVKHFIWHQNWCCEIFCWKNRTYFHATLIKKINITFMVYL